MTLTQVHSECEKMHRGGYCVCTMVECIWCDVNHPPHHPCTVQVEYRVVRAVCDFLLWGAS